LLLSTLQTYLDGESRLAKKLHKSLKANDGRSDSHTELLEETRKQILKILSELIPINSDKSSLAELIMLKNRLMAGENLKTFLEEEFQIAYDLQNSLEVNDGRSNKLIKLLKDTRTKFLRILPELKDPKLDKSLRDELLKESERVSRRLKQRTQPDEALRWFQEEEEILENGLQKSLNNGGNINSDHYKRLLKETRKKFFDILPKLLEGSKNSEPKLYSKLKKMYQDLLFKKTKGEF
jgi:hypothetical protein